MAELSGANISEEGMTNQLLIDGIIYGAESPKCPSLWHQVAI